MKTNLDQQMKMLTSRNASKKSKQWPSMTAKERT